MGRATDVNRYGQAALADIWVAALAATESERNLVQVARDYLATWGPQEIARLPEQSRPGRVHGIEDINECAFNLSQCRLSFTGTLADALLLDRMASFFGCAAQRGSQIQSKGPVAS